MGDIRPTAKWANRILRPLTSIHHRLEKHQDNLSILASGNVKPSRGSHEGWPSTHPHNRPRSSSAAPTLAAATAAAATKDVGFASAREYGSESNSEPDDPVWVPGKPVKRRIRHSYSSRGQRGRGGRRRSRMTIRSPEVQRTLPGAIEIVTPLITGRKKTTTGSVEGTVLPRRLFDDDNDAAATAAAVTAAASTSALPGNGRRKTRASYGGMSATSTTSNSFYAVYNTPWKEALDRCGDPGLADIVRVLDRLLIKFLLSTRVHQPTSESQQQQQQQQHGNGGGSGCGARSLFSTAVRRLPEFIAGEQILQSAEKGRSDEDMCDAYFTELEACYAPSGNGWTPLREAVRAQGIHLVSAMLQKPCFTGLMTCRLLDICVERQEYDAVESLLSELLVSTATTTTTMGETYDRPSAFDSGGLPGDDPVQFLYGYWMRAPGRRTFVFEEIAKLLLCGGLPAEWMVTTRWKKIVDAAILSLSTEENDSAAASHLLEAVLLSASGVFPGRRMIEDIVARGGRLDRMHPGNSGLGFRRQQQSPCPIPIQDALSNLVMSLITALCGMHLARSFTANTAAAIDQQQQQQHQGGTGMRVRTIIGSISFHVQREIEMYYLSDAMAELLSTPSYALRRSSILLGECLVQCSSSNYQPQELSTPTPGNSSRSNNLHTFYLTVSSHSDIIKELADLASQVFSCTQRVRRNDGVSVVDQPGTPVDVRDRVVQLAEMSSQRSQTMFLGRVAAETAMQMAESTVDPDDYAWAVEVQERAAARQARLQGLSTDDTFSDEDGYSDGDQHSDNGNGSGNDEGPRGLYRWEESIEEWVAATPVTKVRTKILVMERSAEGHASNNNNSSRESSYRASTPEHEQNFDHTVSSVTSSASSCVPLKRSYPEPAQPAKKRRRPASWGGVMHRSRAGSVSSSSSSSNSSSNTCASVSKTARRAVSDDPENVDDPNDDWQYHLRSEFRRRNELMMSLREPMPMPMIIQGPDLDQLPPPPPSPPLTQLLPSTPSHQYRHQSLQPSVGYNQSSPGYQSSSHATCSPARSNMGVHPPPEPEPDEDGDTDADTDEDDLCQPSRSDLSGRASRLLFCGSTPPAKRIIPRRSISKPITIVSVAEDEDSDDELSFL